MYNPAISMKHTELVVKEAQEKIKHQSQAYQDYIKYAEEIKDLSKELNEKYDELIIALDKEIEEIRNIGSENERAIIFIDQKQEDDSLESFIIIQDKHFNLYRRELI